MPAKRKVAEDRLVLAIDPSTTFCGIAMGRGPLSADSLLYKSCINLAGEHHERMRDLTEVLDDLHMHYGFNEAVIEMPETRRDPTGLKASQGGAMARLNFAVGAMWQWARKLGNGVTLVPVSVWKGQLSKELMLRRLKRRGICLDLAETSRDMNISDAVALLDWYLESLR